MKTFQFLWILTQMIWYKYWVKLGMHFFSLWTTAQNHGATWGNLGGILFLLSIFKSLAHTYFALCSLDSSLLLLHFRHSMDLEIIFEVTSLSVTLWTFEIISKIGISRHFFRKLKLKSKFSLLSLVWIFVFYYFQLTWQLGPSVKCWEFHQSTPVKLGRKGFVMSRWNVPFK